MTPTPREPNPHRPHDGQEPGSLPTRVVTSAELLRGGRELLIQHADEIYRLRVTRNGKLILHK